MKKESCHFPLLCLLEVWEPECLWRSGRGYLLSISEFWGPWHQQEEEMTLTPLVAQEPCRWESVRFESQCSCPLPLWWLPEKPAQSCTHFWPQCRTCRSSSSSQGWCRWSSLCSSQRWDSCSTSTSEQSAAWSPESALAQSPHFFGWLSEQTQDREALMHESQQSSASLAGTALHPGWNSSRSNCLPAPQRIPPKSI